MAVFRIAFIGGQDEKKVTEIAQKQFGWQEGKDTKIELVDISGMSKKDVMAMGSFQGVLYYGSIRSNEEYLNQLEDIILNQEEL